MRSPPPLHSEAELRAYDRQQAAQKFSYDLTARLTYFVVSAEMVVCGYIFLNAEKFGGVGFSKWLYLFGGIAALSGILWRALYNETFHARTHGNTLSRFISNSQRIFYSVYVRISLLFFILIIWGGYNHLYHIAAPGMEDVQEAVVEMPTNLEKEPPPRSCNVTRQCTRETQIWN